MSGTPFPWGHGPHVHSDQSWSEALEASGVPVTSPARGGPDTAGMREIAAEFLFDFTMRRDNREVRWSDEIGVGALSDETLRSAWRSEADRLMDRLLPVVQRLAVEKAAEELRAAADADDAKPTRWPGSSGEWLRARADALAAAAQPGDGRTGE